MNAKASLPAIANLAPPLLIGVAVFLAVKSLFSHEDEEKKSGLAISPATPKPPASVVPTYCAGNSSSSPVANVAAPATIPVSGPTVAKTPVEAPSPKVPALQIALGSPVSMPRRFIARADLAKVFQNGMRELTRSAAVAALKELGFGKSAAYEALLEGGRFSPWLQFAPDGIVTWKG